MAEIMARATSAPEPQTASSSCNENHAEPPSAARLRQSRVICAHFAADPGGRGNRAESAFRVPSPRTTKLRRAIWLAGPSR